MQHVQTIPAGALRPLDRSEAVALIRGQSCRNANDRDMKRGQSPPSLRSILHNYRLSVAEVEDIWRRFRHTDEPVWSIAAAHHLSEDAVRTIARAIAFDDRANDYV